MVIGEAEAMIDNEKAQKSKKQKSKLEISFEQGDDMHQEVTVLSSGRKAIKFVKKVMKSAEDACREYAYRDWARRFLEDGKAPDIRQFKSANTTVDVTQQHVAKLSEKKVAILDEMGIDVSEYVGDLQTSIDMGVAKELGVDALILEAIEEALDGPDFDAVVSQSSTLGPKFFEAMPDVVKKSLKNGETVLGKMVSTLTALRPTVQFLRPSSDLHEVDAYELTYEFAHISNTAKSQSVNPKSVPVGSIDAKEPAQKRHLRSGNDD